MKYIEEINAGESFSYRENTFIMSSDFRKNGDRLCLSMLDGNTRWLGPSEIVEQVVLYTIDKDSNLVKIREESKNDANQDI